MADLHLDKPPTFLPLPGEPSIQWKMWWKLFDSYLIAIGGTAFTPLRKQHILLNALGVEGRRIYESLPDLPAPVPAGDAPALDCFILTQRKLETHFGQPPNVVMERHHFFMRKQLHGENTLNFVANLRTLAQTCQFDHLQDSLIRDQMVRCCSDKKLTEKLLAIEDLSLDRTIKLMKAAELSNKQVQELEKPWNKVDVAAIKSPELKKAPPHEKKVPRPDKERKPPVCFRCGSLQHLANYFKCPGRSAQCQKCKRFGHLTKACKDGAKVNLVDLPQDQDQDCPDSGSHMLQIKKLGSRYGPWVSLTLDGVVLPMMVDTGSAFSVLSKDVYIDLLKKDLKDLTPTALTPTVYGDLPLTFLGKWTAVLQWNQTSVSADVYVVLKGDTLLGWDQIVSLGLTIHPSKVNPIHCVSDQQTQLKEICREFPTVFEEKIGKVKGYKCKIQLRPNAIPVVHKLRPVKRVLLKPLKEELTKLLKEGIIQEVEGTDWISPLALATKASGEMRMCVNLKKLNNNILVDRHPLPRINEMLMSVTESAVFTSLDLRSAYHQIELDEDSKAYTSFITPFGTYKFNRMPFGLASAASVFQKLMDRLFGDDPNTLCYQDDLLLFSKDMHEHKLLLRKVLMKMKEVGMTLKLEKCKFGCASVDYLGHTLTSKGVLPKEKLVNAVSVFSTPSNKDEVRSFLGLIEYYAKFIRNLADRSQNIRNLLKKNVRFEWSTLCEDEFLDLKREVCEAGCLSPFQEGLKTVVTTDASKKGLGAVLTQVCNGLERTIAFASRTLKGSEANYSAIEREALAIYWAVKHFSVFLWGQSFCVRTDHKPLLGIFNAKDLEDVSPRISKWMQYLGKYNFEVRHLKGESNVVADCLSRLSSECTRDEFPPEQEDVWDCVYVLKDPSFTHKEALSAAERDEVYVNLKRLILDSWPNSKEGLSPELRKFWDVSSQLTIHNHLIFRGSRLLPPVSVRENLIQLAHNGHLGRYLTKKRLRESYWWPGMDAEVERHVRDCLLCATSDKSHQHLKEVVERIPLPGNPWQKIAIDIMGPIEGLGLTKYLIVLVDYLSKWPVVIEAQHVNTSVVIKALQELFRLEGAPQELVSDNGVQFVSSEMEDFLRVHGIKHSCTALYSPRQNGLVERMNRTIKNSLQLAVANGQNWRQMLSDMIWAYRSTPNTETGKTPFELMRGRLATHKLTPPWLFKRDEQDGENNIRTGCVNPDIKPGDWVRIRRKGILSKLDPKWGVPVKVEKVFKNVLEIEGGKRWSFSDVTKCFPVESPSAVRESVDIDLDEIVCMEEESHVDDVVEPRQAAELEPGVVRPRRQVNLPQRLQDYVLT